MSHNKTLNIDRFERIFAYVTAERMSIIVPVGRECMLRMEMRNGRRTVLRKSIQWLIDSTFVSAIMMLWRPVLFKNKISITYSVSRRVKVDEFQNNSKGT